MRERKELKKRERERDVERRGKCGKEKKMKE